MRSNNNILRFIFITLMVFVVDFAYAQTNIRSQSVYAQSPNIRNDLGKGKNPSPKPDKSQNTRRDYSKPQKSTKPIKADTIVKDTVYAMETVKQHGWFSPKGVISREIAQHRGVSIRFTNKNKKGKWLKMEVLDAYGQYVPGRIPPYILKNSNDSLANQNWKKKIESSCIYEFIPDPTGMNVIQERAYDKDYNIVYTYSRTGIGKNSEGKQQFIGSYKDFYGLPAEMRPQEGYSYGTLVKITEDQWGNDSIIEYIDSKGINKLNADLAAKEYFIYDKDGNLLRQQSRDSIGNLIIANAGNCGIEFTYDEQGNMKTATFMDEKWEPMYLPNTIEADEKAGIQRIEWNYDEYGRQTEMRFVDLNGDPDENVHGCHRTTYEYDEHGNYVRQASYSSKNVPIAQGWSGTSIYEFKFDSKGRMVEGHFLDANKKPCSTKGYLSKVIKKYDDNDELILDEQYSAETGNEELCYKYENTPQYTYTRWGDGTSRIASLDIKGRTTYIGYYGADGKLEMTGGRAYEVYTYLDENKRTTIVETYYDTMGNMVDINGRCREITVADSLNWTKNVYRYNTDNFLTETFIHRYSPDFGIVIGQDDSNENGILSRSGGSSSVRYLKGDVVYNRKIDDLNSITHLYGIDEFGEPDYIASTSVLFYYSKQFPHSATKYYDEHNAEIEDDDEARDRLPKVMTIEVTDSAAYRLGLKDNDVILLYGDYAVDLDTTVSYLTFKQEWTLRSVIDAQKEKRMVVFRVTDPSKNEYGLFEIKGLKGTCMELGFIPHIRYLTDRQLGRIKESINSAVNKPDAFVSHSDLKKTNNKGGDNYILLAYTEMYRSYRDKPYAEQVGDPSILLGSCIKDRNLAWTIVEGSDTKPFVTMLSSRRSSDIRYPRQDFFVTKDGHSLTHIILDEQAVCTKWSDAYISDEDYRQISNLYEAAYDSIETIIKSNKSINRKQFYGNWITQNEDALQYSPKAQLNFSKDGTFVGTIVNYGYIGFTEGNAIYKIDKKVRGTWNNGGNWLFFYPDDDEISLSCVDLLGTDDEDLKQRAISYMNSICESSKDALLEEMEYEDNRIRGDMYVTSISKNVLDVQFSSGSHLTLIKSKDNLPVSTKNERTNMENFQQ